jgi:hypothetical protein
MNDMPMQHRAAPRRAAMNHDDTNHDLDTDRPALPPPTPPPPPVPPPPSLPTPDSVGPAVVRHTHPAPPIESTAEARPHSRRTKPRGLTLVAVAIAGLAASSAAGAATRRGEEGAYIVGAVIGSVAFIAIVGAIVKAFTSRRGGLIAAIVTGALMLVGATVQLAEGQQAGRESDAAADQAEIDDAVEEADSDTAVEAIADGEDGDFDAAADLTPEEVACIEASGLLTDEAFAATKDTGDLGAAAQLEWFDVAAACAPQALLSDAAVASFRQSFSVGMPSQITDSEARCVISALTALPKPSEVMSSGNPDVLIDLLTPCLGEASLAMVQNEPGTGPQVIGEDPAFDRLAERCREGVDIACDTLFAVASTGSEYSDLAADCAGRGINSPITCLEGFVDDDANGLPDDDSPGWSQVIEACRDGDMLACDFTFVSAEFAGAHTRVAETCGGRRATIGTQTCVERYGETAD